MMLLIIALLSLSTLVLAFTFEAGLVYVWIFISSIYVLFPEILLVEGMKQSLYGAASLACLPSMTVVFLRRIMYLRKFLIPFLPILGVILVVIFSGHWHKVPTIEVLRTIGGIVVFAFMCLFSYAFLSNERSLKILIVILAVLSVAVCISALVDFTLLHKMTRFFGTTERAGSIFVKNPNVLSHYCLFFFSVFLAMFLELKKPFLLGVCAFYFFCILITFSNAGIAAALASSCVTIFLYKLYKRPLYMFYFVLLFFLLIIILFQMKYFYSPSLHHISTGGTFNYRVEHLWPDALILINKSIMIGYTPDLAFNLLGRSAHNEVLGMLLNFGVIGSLAIIVFLFVVFVKLHRVRIVSDSAIVKGSAAGCITYMCGSAIYGIAHSIGFTSTIVFPFWFLAMALIGVLKELRK